MAETKKSANGTSTSNVRTTKEMKEWYDKHKKDIENFANSQQAIHNLRDVSKTSARSIQTINKQTLKTYISNIGSNEKNLRNTARYLYYRSNVLFRIINWYAGMWDLNCRKVVPKVDLRKSINSNKTMKSYYDTLDYLELLNIQGITPEALLNVYIEDVYYAIRYTDEFGTFLYRLEPDECMISGRYSTMDFAFKLDMSKWRGAQRQQIIEYLGSPFTEMYREYENTNEKWIAVPDEYAFCLKFRTDIWDLAVPPLLTTFLQMASLEDLVDIQAEADALSIYKLIYMPLKVHNNSNSVDDFQIDPALAKKYFDVLLNGAIPENVAGAMVPGDELKTIDFSKGVDSDTNSVEKASNQVLQTAGGGAVINASQITSTAAFEAWLEAETQFAMSTLLPQIDGIVNRYLSYELGDSAATVKHFEVSVYTKKKLRESLMESCQYSFANRLAYNTLNGISEKESLIMLHFENEILGLPDLMKFPLTSSFTSSGKDEVGQIGEGAPTKDADELTTDGERSRNK